MLKACAAVLAPNPGRFRARWKRAPTAAAGLHGARIPKATRCSLCSRPTMPKAVSRAQRHRPPHHPRRLPGAQPRRRGHLLPRSARLPPLLVRRHGRGQARLGEPADPRQPRLAGIHADQRPLGLRHSGRPCRSTISACSTISPSAKSPWMRLTRPLKKATAWAACTMPHTQIGKDGKGQFNLYDPDGIRLELMNFHASEKPCCSPFTADDPAE